MDPYLKSQLPMGFNPSFHEINYYPTNNTIIPQNCHINYTTANIDNINSNQFQFAQNSVDNFSLPIGNYCTKKVNNSHVYNNGNAQYNYCDLFFKTFDSRDPSQPSNLGTNFLNANNGGTAYNSLYYGNWSSAPLLNDEIKKEMNLYTSIATSNNSSCNSPKYLSPRANSNINFINPNAAAVNVDPISTTSFSDIMNTIKCGIQVAKNERSPNTNEENSWLCQNPFFIGQGFASNANSTGNNSLDVKNNYPLQCAPHYFDNFNTMKSSNDFNGAEKFNSGPSRINNNFGTDFSGIAIINPSNSTLPKRNKKSKSTQTTIVNGKNTTPFVCDYKECGKVFKRRDDLKRHIKMHYGGKPFACKYCGSSFGRTDHLRTHMRVHSGEKPYKCLLCEKAFKRSDERSRHFLSHDKKEGLAPGSTKQKLKLKGLLEKVYVARMSSERLK